MPSAMTPPQDDDAADSASEVKASKKKPRRVMDIELNDGKPKWEDELQQLQGLGATTHRSRNPAQAVIPIHKHTTATRGVNVCETARCKHTTGDSQMKAFVDDMDAWEEERKLRAEVLAEKHGMKLKEVRWCMLSGSALKTNRKANLYNAKISAVMARRNEILTVNTLAHEMGDRHKMPEVKRMAMEDPSMLEGFSPEEEKEMLAELVSKRKHKSHGACATNLAANVDAKRTMERLMAEISALAERAGMMGFAMFLWGHVHDTTVPVAIQSWGALEFFWEVLKKDPTDVSKLFGLWALNREQALTKGNTFLTMQKECTEMIKSGLHECCCMLRMILYTYRLFLSEQIAKMTKIAMNYENYISALVEGKGFGLLGWPKEVEFKRMSKQSTIGLLRILRDALKCRTCRWKFEDMVETGEAIKKAKAPRKWTRKAGEELVARKSKRVVRKHLQAKDNAEDDAEDEEPSEGEGPRKAIVEMTTKEKHKRLLALRKKTSSKRKVAAAGDEGCAVKRTKGAKPSASRSKRPRVLQEDEEDNDNAPRQPKKAKTSSGSASKLSKPSTAPTVERPRLRPKPKPKPRLTRCEGATHPTCVTTDLLTPRDFGTKEYPDWASCLPEMDDVRPGHSTLQLSLGHCATIHWG
ncbi:hypothetical protein FB451DRAFT_1174210 [Mycena latifolia]|nr:hypothetical protein FB451DRAFT_1174210 [Mycena latifolia]